MIAPKSATRAGSPPARSRVPEPEAIANGIVAVDRRIEISSVNEETEPWEIDKNRVLVEYLYFYAMRS